MNWRLCTLLLFMLFNSTFSSVKIPFPILPYFSLVFPFSFLWSSLFVLFLRPFLFPNEQPFSVCSLTLKSSLPLKKTKIKQNKTKKKKKKKRKGIFPYLTSFFHLCPDSIRKWWRFAITSILHGIQDKRRRKSPKFISERIGLLKHYTAVYTNILEAKVDTTQPMVINHFKCLGLYLIPNILIPHLSRLAKKCKQGDCCLCKLPPN